VPEDALKMMEKQEVILVITSVNAKGIFIAKKVTFDRYECSEGEEGNFVFQCNEDTKTFLVVDYEESYFVMMERKDYWNHIEEVYLPAKRLNPNQEETPETKKEKQK
jgi:hypothetical protein